MLHAHPVSPFFCFADDGLGKYKIKIEVNLNRSLHPVHYFFKEAIDPHVILSYYFFLSFIIIRTCLCVSV